MSEFRSGYETHKVQLYITYISSVSMSYPASISYFTIFSFYEDAFVQGIQKGNILQRKIEIPTHPPLKTHPEIEFLNDIFCRGFWVLNRFIVDLRFGLVFYPSFFVLQNAIHERLKFSCFAYFLYGILKPEQEYVFL